MIDTNWILSELKTTLALLSAPAEEQIDYLEKNHVHQDELALDFDAVAPVTPFLREEGILSEEQSRAIEAVHQQLDIMSGSEHALLWEDEGIRRAPEWSKVRVLAKDALARLIE